MHDRFFGRQMYGLWCGLRLTECWLCMLETCSYDRNAIDALKRSPSVARMKLASSARKETGRKPLRVHDGYIVTMCESPAPLCCSMFLRVIDHKQRSRVLQSRSCDECPTFDN